MANYIGKIAAVVTANVSDVAPKLSASAREWNKYGKSVQASIDAARRNARSSFDQIFTAQQRLERAFAASRNTTLRINTREGEDAIRRLIGAADELARPLIGAQKQFSSLSSSIQNEFGRALSEAQNAARSAAAAINETGRLGEQSFERYKRRVDEAVVSIRRLSEANAAVGGLATGRELRFQQAGFAAELQRTSALQSQASALPADARASGAVAQLVELQRREAEEAARLLAVLESVRNTRRGDAAAAQANLDAQIQRQRLVNDQLERQISLSNAAKQARSVRDRASASETRASGGFASLEEAQRGADGLFSRIERLGPQAFRSLAGEIDGLASAFATGFIGPVNNDFQRLLRRVEELESRANRLREASAGLAIITPEEAAADTPEAIRQGFRRRIANNLLTTVTPEEAAADTPEAVDQRRRREVATTFLPPVIDLPPDPRQASLERTQALADRLGPDLASSSSALSRLESSTVSLKNQIDQLPAPLRAKFIPAIRQAENELLRLTAADDALPEDVERAAVGVRNLETQIGLASRAAQQFGGSFREFADASDSRAAAGGLEFLRQTLLRATGDTRAAEDAVDRYSAALQRAAAVPGGFRQFAGDLSRIRQQAVAAVAATEGVGLSARRINEGIRRTGDVARGSFGNTGLAIQQAAFIVDDFFSVTGGIEQRIRAIGNNISQLGFIVGGTYGLIVGVAVSVGAQAASALIKWANAGRSTENQTRALNEILQRQKTVVEELASAFNSLGQQIVSRGFSPAATAANELADRLKEIVRLQREAAESSLTETSQGVADRRADQDVIRQRLESETNVGRRLALQRQLAASQRAERADLVGIRLGAADSLRLPRGLLNPEQERFTRPVASNRPAGEEVAALLRRVAEEARQRTESRQGINRTADFLSGSTRQPFLVASQRLEGFAESLDLGTSADAIKSQADALQQAIELFRNSSTRTLIGFNTDAANEASEFIRVLTDVRKRILSDVNASINQTINQTLQEADRASRAFADAQRAAQEAVERGVVGSEAFASGVDAASESIKRSIAAINEVVAGVDSDGRQVERTPEQIRAIVSREQANIGRLQTQAQASDQQTLQARLGRVIGGERATAALQSLQGAESFANEYAGLTAQLQRAVEVERIARERAARSSDAQSLAALAAARAASDLAASAAESALAIDSEFAGLRRGLDEALQSSRQQLDEAQQRVNDASAFGARPSDSVLRRRDAAEANFLADRSRISQLQSRLSEARSAALESPEIQDINRRLEAIRTRREQASERARVSGATEDVSEANRLAEEQVRLENERVLVLQRLTSATRQATEAETASSRLAAQGRELLATPGQRAGEELVRQLQAVRAAFEQSARLAGQPVDIARRQQAENRLFQDQVAQIAPIRVEFAREIQNAILAGPSRAPLQASDASSVEGRRELDRLLRRDDPAASANFAELQRVNANLRDLIQATRENAAPVAE